MSRQTKLSELRQDLAEYRKLFQTAERPRVKQILTKQITVLNSEISKIQKQIELQLKKSVQVQEVKQEKQQFVSEPINKNSNVIYTALTKYSWQDESKKVKIYFSLENVGAECTADLIDVQFKQNSVELKIRNYRKQNLLFSLKKTYADIIPEQCKYLVKTNLLSITLTKKSTGTWTQLNWKQDKFANKQKQPSADPNASIMNMMKKMYQEGDETMKKTIAEAWTKSKDKKDSSDSFKLD